MHELAHAYHDQVLGFDDEEIIAAFQQAKKAKIYESVLAHNHRKVKHYSLTNHKEYFAESTESYLGVNDFYPFVRAELKEHDPRMFFLQEKIWGKIGRWILRKGRGLFESAKQPWFTNAVSSATAISSVPSRIVNSVVLT